MISAGVCAWVQTMSGGAIALSRQPVEQGPTVEIPPGVTEIDTFLPKIGLITHCWGR